MHKCQGDNLKRPYKDIVPLKKKKKRYQRNSGHSHLKQRKDKKQMVKIYLPISANGEERTLFFEAPVWWGLWILLLSSTMNNRIFKDQPNNMPNQFNIILTLSFTSPLQKYILISFPTNDWKIHTYHLLGSEERKTTIVGILCQRYTQEIQDGS